MDYEGRKFKREELEHELAGEEEDLRRERQENLKRVREKADQMRQKREELLNNS